MKNPNKVCERCHLPRSDGHRHCGDCGATMLKGVATKHQEGCVKSWHPKPGQVCPRCKKLLAAGAHCPVHGDPMPKEAA